MPKCAIASRSSALKYCTLLAISEPSELVLEEIRVLGLHGFRYSRITQNIYWRTLHNQIVLNKPLIIDDRYDRVDNWFVCVLQHIERPLTFKYVHST